jgi:hypothetical protein
MALAVFGLSVELFEYILPFQFRVYLSKVKAFVIGHCYVLCLWVGLLRSFLPWREWLTRWALIATKLRHSPTLLRILSLAQPDWAIRVVKGFWQ